MKEILVDKNGYKQYLDEIEKMKDQINTIASTGSSAYKEAVGDGWHDNFAFEDTMRENRMMNAKLNSLRDDKKYIKVIKSVKEKEDIVNIGNKLRISVIYSEDDIEEYDIILTGNYLPNLESEITEITLNSPIGKAIYLKNINNDIKAIINDKDITIKIIKKYND